MAYDIPLQDGKPLSKLQKEEPWGYALSEDVADYGTLKPQNLLKVSENPEHAIYYQEYGNPAGEPVFVLHGGPGGGGMKEYGKFFDPKHYRIIVADQRGCNFSEPDVSKNPSTALKDNDTPHLIEDIEKLRAHLGIKGKMHVMGGSWGSTLSLAYAIAHPENVKTLQLRGIFLGKKNVFDYFYQGNAATYDNSKPFAEQDFSEIGTYRAYMGDGTLRGQIPEEARTPSMANAYATAWQNYVTQIDPDAVFADGPLKGHRKREDMVAAYSEIFEMPEPLSEEQRATQLEAAKAWSIWEGTTSNLNHDVSDLSRFPDPKFAVNFSRIENRFFMHGCYLGMDINQNPDDMLNHRDNNFIMENLDRLKGIEWVGIVHGEHDQVTLKEDADALETGLKERGIPVKRWSPQTNHSALERDNAASIVAISDYARDNHPFKFADWEPQPKNYTVAVKTHVSQARDGH